MSKKYFLIRCYDITENVHFKISKEIENCLKCRNMNLASFVDSYESKCLICNYRYNVILAFYIFYQYNRQNTNDPFLDFNEGFEDFEKNNHYNKHLFDDYNDVINRLLNDFPGVYDGLFNSEMVERQHLLKCLKIYKSINNDIIMIEYDKCKNFLELNGWNCEQNKDAISYYKDDSIAIDITANEITLIADHGDFCSFKTNYFSLLGALIHYRQVGFNVRTI